MQSPTQQKMSGSWKQFVGKVKERWGELTEDDLDRYEGQMDQLEGYIEKRTGQKRAAIHDEIDRLARNAKYSV